MPFREILKQTLAALWDSKLRSFLTMFGILWGITSVILLVGLGIGFSIQQRKQLRTIGTDIAICFGGKTAMPFQGYAAGRDVTLTIDDAIAIQKFAPLIKTVSPEIRKTVDEVSQWNASNRGVRGVWPEYQRFRSLTVDQGRLMSAEDEADGARVVVLGAESERQLFPGKPSIGQPVQISGYPYTVIGVLAKKQQNGSYGSGPDNTQLFVPFSAMVRDFPPDFKGSFPGFVNNIVVQPVRPEL
ncbi:MAG TPA: ABC transporter permease, partial [Acidobacteriaceae bacterium]